MVLIGLILPLVQIALNNAPLLNTPYSPFYLTYGYHPTFYQDLYQARPTSDEPIPSFITRMSHVYSDIMDRLMKNHIRMSKNANAHRSDHTLRVGDLVLINAAKRAKNQGHRLPKLSPRWQGPFRITAALNENTFRLDMPSSFHGHNVFHSEYLRPYFSLDDDAVSSAPVSPDSPFWLPLHLLILFVISLLLLLVLLISHLLPNSLIIPFLPPFYLLFLLGLMLCLILRSFKSFATLLVLPLKLIFLLQIVTINFLLIALLTLRIVMLLHLMLSLFLGLAVLSTLILLGN